MIELIGYAYIVGMFLAIIIGCIEMYELEKVEFDVDEFPAGIVFIAFLSWIYVFYFVYLLYNALKK